MAASQESLLPMTAANTFSSLAVEVTRTTLCLDTWARSIRAQRVRALWFLITPGERLLGTRWSTYKFCQSPGGWNTIRWRFTNGHAKQLRDRSPKQTSAGKI